MQTAPQMHDGELLISLGESRKDTNWRTVTMRWSELVRKLSQTKRTNETMEEYEAMPRDLRGEVKDVGGFVGGPISGGQRKNGNVAFRQLLTLDADYGTLELWDDWELMQGYAACMYSTHSHTPKAPRLRLIIPLSRPCDREEYEAVARKVASWLGMEAFDDTTYEVARLMYWPSTASDGEFIFRSCDGEWLDADAVLASYKNWRDVSEWPVSSRKQKELHAYAERQGDPLEKPGVVGAFNRTYTVTAAIEKFLSDRYLPTAHENRYTYYEGSTIGGLVIYDDDLFAYSHHDSDPCSGRLCSAYDLVRLHLYGELDEGSTESVHKRPSTDKMKELCKGDEAVLAELEARIKETASGDFAENHPDDHLLRLVDDLTEQGNAVRFADRFRDVLRWQSSLGWMAWDGVKWQAGAEPEATLLAMRFADDLMSEAQQLMQLASTKEDREYAKTRLKWASSSRSKSKVSNMLSLAKSLLNEPDAGVFDPEPWALNTPGGIIDLKTGKMGPHDSTAMCTMCTEVGPDEDMPRPLWDAFLDRLTGGDKAYQEYLQIAAGMSAVGKVYEEGMIISHGPGGNGKSTFFGVWLDLLGSYADTIRPELLMSRGNGQDIAGLEGVRGKRLIVTAETDEGAKLSISAMKRLTSRDPISANPKYLAPFSFNPTHTLLMHTNFLPGLRSVDGGTKRRIAVAPFEMQMAEGEIITDFGNKLVLEEGPAILSWIIKGAQKFFDGGLRLPRPAVVKAASDRYMEAEDWLGNFLAERCLIGQDQQAMGEQLYQEYKAYAEMNGDYVRRNRDFAAELTKRGYARTRTKKGRVWTGLSLLSSNA